MKNSSKLLSMLLVLVLTVMQFSIFSLFSLAATEVTEPMQLNDSHYTIENGEFKLNDLQYNLTLYTDLNLNIYIPYIEGLVVTAQGADVLGGRYFVENGITYQTVVFERNSDQIDIPVQVTLAITVDGTEYTQVIETSITKYLGQILDYSSENVEFVQTQPLAKAIAVYAYEVLANDNTNPDGNVASAELVYLYNESINAVNGGDYSVQDAIAAAGDTILTSNVVSGLDASVVLGVSPSFNFANGNGVHVSYTDINGATIDTSIVDGKLNVQMKLCDFNSTLDFSIGGQYNYATYLANANLRDYDAVAGCLYFLAEMAKEYKLTFTEKVTEYYSAYELVTDASTLKVGDTIVITNKDATYALGAKQNKNNRAQVAITKNGNTITVNDNVQLIELKSGATDGQFGLYATNKDPSGTSNVGYLYAASSSDNYLRTKSTLDGNGSWTITISGGTASIVANGNYSRKTMQYNSSSSLFSCYSSATQGALAVYKLVEKEVVVDNSCVDAKKLLADKAALETGIDEIIIGNDSYDLPEAGANSTIVWSIKNSVNGVMLDGASLEVEQLEEEYSFTLVANLILNGKKVVKEFTYTVAAMPDQDATPMEKIAAVTEIISTYELNYNVSNGYITSTSIKLFESVEGYEDVTITWYANGSAVNGYTYTVPAQTSAVQTIELTAWLECDGVESTTAVFSDTFKVAAKANEYVKITSVSQITNGAKIVIFATGKNCAMGAMSGSMMSKVDMTNDGKITETEATKLQVVTVVKNSDNTYSLSLGNGKYLGYSGSSNNITTGTSIANLTKWKITYASGAFKIESVNVSGRFIQYNSSNPRFCCYKGTQINLDIYMLGA